MRGFAYDAQGEHERAIQDYDEAIRLDPHDAEAYYSRGMAYDLSLIHISEPTRPY